MASRPRYDGEGFVVDESLVTAQAIGTPFGIPGRDRTLRFRLLHVFEIGDRQRPIVCGADVAGAWAKVPFHRAGGGAQHSAPVSRRRQGRCRGPSKWSLWPTSSPVAPGRDVGRRFQTPCYLRAHHDRAHGSAGETLMTA
jgi:hypothetical protein